MQAQCRNRKSNTIDSNHETASCTFIRPIVSVIRILLTACIFFTAQFVAHADGARFRKGPYLIYQGDNTQMTVTRQTDTEPTTTTLEWGSTTAYGTLVTHFTGTATNLLLVSCTLTGLTPGKRYYYRVSIDEEEETGSLLAGRKEVSKDMVATEFDFTGFFMEIQKQQQPNSLK